MDLGSGKTCVCLVTDPHTAVPTCGALGEAVAAPVLQRPVRKMPPELSGPAL